MARDYIFVLRCPFCDKSHYLLGKEHQYPPFGALRFWCDGTKIGHDFVTDKGHDWRWQNMTIVGRGPLRTIEEKDETVSRYSQEISR